jgi:hypothetical protein
MILSENIDENSASNPYDKMRVSDKSKVAAALVNHRTKFIHGPCIQLVH